MFLSWKENATEQKKKRDVGKYRGNKTTSYHNLFAHNKYSIFFSFVQEEEDGDTTEDILLILYDSFFVLGYHL